MDVKMNLQKNVRSEVIVLLSLHNDPAVLLRGPERTRGTSAAMTELATRGSLMSEPSLPILALGASIHGRSVTTLAAVGF